MSKISKMKKFIVGIITTLIAIIYFVWNMDKP